MNALMPILLALALMAILPNESEGADSMPSHSMELSQK